MVFTYTLMQLATWWLIHTTALFWKISFPFHSRSFQMSHKIKYLHAASIIVGIVIPLVPVIASVADSAVDYNPSTNVSFLNSGLGFAQTRFPPILCTGNDGDVVFYSVVLPIDMALAVGCTLLIYIFWIIHKCVSIWYMKRGVIFNLDKASKLLAYFIHTKCSGGSRIVLRVLEHPYNSYLPTKLLVEIRN